jgi:hypothetical protein
VAIPIGIVVVLAGAVFIPPFLDAVDREGPRKEPLRPPGHVSAEGQCGGVFDADVTVRWRPTATARADGYEVYRGTGSGGPYERVGIVEGRASTAFVDDGVGQNSTYFYVVRATDGRKVSPPSGQTQAETPLICL